MGAAALSAALFPAASAQSTLPPIPANIVCSRFACAVEFWGRGSGIQIETRSRAEAEELVSILLENSGRDYAFAPEFWRAARSKPTQPALRSRR